VGEFLHTDVVRVVAPGCSVAYFGDWNPAGSAIEANTRRVLEREMGPLIGRRDPYLGGRRARLRQISRY